MVNSPEEKIAELSVMVNDLKQKVPVLEQSMSEIYNMLTRDKVNLDMLVKQYDKLYEVVEDFKQIQFSVRKLNEDSERFGCQIDNLKSKVEEALFKENNNSEIIHQFQKLDKPKNWNFEKIISLAPNIFIILSVIGYICYLVLVDKAKSGF